MKTMNEIKNIIKKDYEMNKDKSDFVINNIRKEIREYINNNNIQSLVIGISGGLDSSVVAALCQEKYTGVPLIGISIPMSSSNEHREQAQYIGDNYCTVFEEFKEWDEEIPLKNDMRGSVYTSYEKQFFNKLEETDKIAIKAGFKVDNFPKNILQGNMKARLRMITLYDLARKTNGLVLSTDNFSELMMGFWTICGDVGDYGPIQNIYKGIELPQIANRLNIRKDIVTQKPSDGLMVTEDNTDEAQLGADYETVDVIINVFTNPKYQYLIEDIKSSEVVKNIYNRYIGTQFKRNGTINLTRKQIGI